MPFDALDKPLDSVTFNYDRKRRRRRSTSHAGSTFFHDRKSIVKERVPVIENRKRKVFITSSRIYYTLYFLIFKFLYWLKFVQFVRSTNRIYLSIVGKILLKGMLKGKFWGSRRYIWLLLKILLIQILKKLNKIPLENRKKIVWYFRSNANISINFDIHLTRENIVWKENFVRASVTWNFYKDLTRISYRIHLRFQTFLFLSPFSLSSKFEPREPLVSITR